jgi:plastocyanin
MFGAGWARLVVAGIGAALLWQTGVVTDAKAQAGVEVSIEAFVYQPNVIKVPVGTTVTWINHDPVAHTVTDINQLWDSGLFDEAVSYSKTFDAPGTYSYYCIPHQIMIGTVEVSG